MCNIINLLTRNGNLDTNSRQQNSTRQQNSARNQNRQQTSNRHNVNSNNVRYNNFVNEPIYNYPNVSSQNLRIPNLIYNFLEPIEIYPTPSQIEVATRVERFGDITNPLNTSCPITLENFNENDQVLVIRQCSHIFSNSGLISWFRSNCRCPVCRYDIRDYASPLLNSNSVIPNNTVIPNNIDVSSNILPSSSSDVERRPRNTTSNVLLDLIFSSLLDTRNVIDPSGNNINFNRNNNVSDMSGNLLHLLFTHE